MADPQATASPFCTRLRTKKYYFLEAPALTEADLLDASGHCWCSVTQQSVGPDGDIVLPDECRAQRKCYEPFPPKV